MALETGDYISDLIETNPEGVDNVSQGDDHLRLIKHVLRETWPNMDGPFLGTPEDLNTLPVVAAEPVNAGVHKTSRQGLTSGSWSKIVFDDIRYDTDTQFDSVGVFTCKVAGLYSVNALCNGSTFADGGTFNMRLYKTEFTSGLEEYFRFAGVDSAKASSDLDINGSINVNLLEGDKLDIRCRVEQSGIGVNSGSYFDIVLNR